MLGVPLVRGVVRYEGSPTEVALPLPDDCERALVRRRWFEVAKVLGHEIFGQREVIGVAATSGPHAAPDRFAIRERRIVSGTTPVGSSSLR